MWVIRKSLVRRIAEYDNLVYRVSWLRAKAAQKRWEEEAELVTAEFEWTIRYFNKQASIWRGRQEQAKNQNRCGHSCYAARQASIYAGLREQCRAQWNKFRDNADWVVAG